MKRFCGKRNKLLIIFSTILLASCPICSMLTGYSYIYNKPKGHEVSDEEILQFSEGFLWGAATASYQVEGGNVHSNWWRFEQIEGEIKNGDRTEKAADHYNRFEEDFDLARELNLNSYRFSIEWSRIEPEKGKFDQKEIEHYREVLQALKKRKIKPVVTLWHHSIPTWFEDIGAWEVSENIKYYIEYVEIVVENFSDDVEIWLTMNEPMAYISCSYVSAKWAPGKKDYVKVPALLKNLIQAHKEAYQMIHAHDSSAQVGIAEHSSYTVPFTENNPLENLIAFTIDYSWTHFFLGQIDEYLDFIGLHYYYKQPIRLALALEVVTKNAEEFENNSLDRLYYPQGLYEVLMRFRRYDLPIYITEIGVPDYHEISRDQFIREHVREVYYAIQAGIDVRGFYYWALMDSFEWTEGYDAEFGLIDIDYEEGTLDRKIKKESWEYALIAGCHCVSNN